MTLPRINLQVQFPIGKRVGIEAIESVARVDGRSPDFLTFGAIALPEGIHRVGRAEVMRKSVILNDASQDRSGKILSYKFVFNQSKTRRTRSLGKNFVLPKMLDRAASVVQSLEQV